MYKHYYKEETESSGRFFFFLNQLGRCLAGHQDSNRLLALAAGAKQATFPAQGAATFLLPWWSCSRFPR